MYEDYYQENNHINLSNLIITLRMTIKNNVLILLRTQTAIKFIGNVKVILIFIKKDRFLLIIS